MTQNRIFIFVSVVLCVAVVVIAVQAMSIRMAAREHGETKRQLRMKDREIAARQDSIHDLQAKMEARDLAWAHKVTSLRDSVKIATAGQIKWQKEYARIKNSHVDRNTSDGDLDSKITGFLTEH